MADDADIDQSLARAGGEKPRKPARPAPAPVPPRKPGIANVARTLTPAAYKPAAVQPAEVEDDTGTPLAMRLAFLGAGQGGGKIAQAFRTLGYRRVAAFNTTDSDFNGLDADMPKLSLDIGGAAKDMTLARNALVGRDEEVWDLMARAWGTKVDCALVCAGLGGGSGGGAALPLVRLARKYLEARGMPARVGAVVALPRLSDGQKVARNAVTAFRELVDAGASPILVIDNDKVNTVYHNPPMARLLPMTNTLVAALLHLFNHLAAVKSEHVTFDRAEFAQLLDAGIAVLGSAEVPATGTSTPADVSKTIRDELAGGVLADVDLGTARAAACLFVAADDVLDTFSSDYFDAGFDMLNRLVGEGEDRVVHRGLYPGGEAGLQCYTMIAGVAPPAPKLAALARLAGLPAPAASSVAKHLRVD